MAGLSHFTTAKAAVSLYEPVYLNQFEVILQPPAAVSNPAGNAGRSLLVENIVTITNIEILTIVWIVSTIIQVAIVTTSRKVNR